MLQRDMSYKDLHLGRYVRPDGNHIDITARLYETPAEYDYWRVVYDAAHEEWGHSRFVLTIPKKLAPIPDLASTIIRGSAYTQVERTLATANSEGRDLPPYYSADGWTLIEISSLAQLEKRLRESGPPRSS